MRTGLRRHESFEGMALRAHRTRRDEAKRRMIGIRGMVGQTQRDYTREHCAKRVGQGRASKWFQVCDRIERVR